MILSKASGSVKPEPQESRPASLSLISNDNPSTDPRLDLLRRWLDALDRSDWRQGNAVARELRAEHGIVICPRGTGGR
jgi:hypothetical protein